MKNGRYDGDDDPKVTRLSDARRRAAQKARSAGEPGRRRGPRSVQEWVMGGVIMAMAAGMLAYAVVAILRSLGMVAR